MPYPRSRNKSDSNSQDLLKQVPSYDEIIRIKETEPKHNRIQLVSSSEIVPINPKYTFSPEEGVSETLKERVLKFDEKLCGVVLSYKIDICSNGGVRMYDDDPRPHVKCDITFAVFVAKPMCNVVAQVTRMGTKHIGCLIHQCIQVTVNTFDLKPEIINVLKMGEPIVLKLISFTFVSRRVSFVAWLHEKTMAMLEQRLLTFSEEVSNNLDHTKFEDVLAVEE